VSRTLSSKVACFGYRVIDMAQRLPWRIKAKLLQRLLGACGSGVSIAAGFDIPEPHNVFIGNDVYLGPRVCILAANARARIGSKVMFGPDVTLVTGDHDITKFGVFMCDVHEKSPGADADIVIQDDVWVGSGAIVLKGVTLRRGCVVGAGAVVTKSTEPYSIVAGNPAVHRRYRISPGEIESHEKAIRAGCTP
jgi:acetyltransferase-like isoleucine patch superfamily enzyme